MKKDEVLNKALELITGERASNYGDAVENHQRIANGWNLILTDAIKTHGMITPGHVALMMDWLKTSRLLVSMDHMDSWIDKAGYSGIGGEIAGALKGAAQDQAGKKKAY